MKNKKTPFTQKDFAIIVKKHRVTVGDRLYHHGIEAEIINIFDNGYLRLHLKEADLHGCTIIDIRESEICNDIFYGDEKG